MTTNELVSFTHKYSIVPAKVTILYKKKASMNELYKASIVDYPILLQMEAPDNTEMAFVFKNELDNNIFLFIDDDLTLSTIAHECVHIVSEIFKYIRSPMNESTEEFFAYLLDYTFEQIVLHCKETLKLKLKLK